MAGIFFNAWPFTICKYAQQLKKFQSRFNIWPKSGWPPQLHGFVCAYNPAAPGSNPKHTIYALKKHLAKYLLDELSTNYLRLLKNSKVEKFGQIWSHCCPMERSKSTVIKRSGGLAVVCLPCEQKGCIIPYCVTLATPFHLFPFFITTYFGPSRTTCRFFIMLALQRISCTFSRQLFCYICHHTLSVFRMSCVL